MSEHIVILKKAALDKLRDNVADNMERYESDSPNWGEFFGADDFMRTTQVEICGDNFGGCLGGDFDPTTVIKDDPARCESIYKALQNLTPKQATDERVWAYLTHFVFWDYARARWPLPADKSKRKQSVLAHFFVGGVRGMVRDNAVSRLWWMAHVCNRLQNCELADSLGALLLKEDARKEIMERATFCRSEPIFNSLMNFMLRSFKGNQKLHERKNFRQLSKELNRVGGVRVLDSLEPPHLDGLIENIIRGMGLSPDFPGDPNP